MNILERATMHRSWLAQRQSVVAENIANSNTPGYAARSVASFDEVLAVSQRFRPAITDPRHIGAASTDVLVVETEAADAVSATHSGNTVDLEKELMSAGEVKSLFALNVSVVKAFNRMLQISIRS